MYKVIYPFRDAEDDFYQYEPGDNFPRQGVKVETARITVLEGARNNIGRPLIERAEAEKRGKNDQGNQDQRGEDAED